MTFSSTYSNQQVEGSSPGPGFIFYELIKVVEKDALLRRAYIKKITRPNHIDQRLPTARTHPGSQL